MVYYERLAAHGGAEGVGADALSMLYRDVQQQWLPRDALSDWLTARYASATHFYALRRQWSAQLTVIGWLEHVAHATRQMPRDLLCRLDDGGLLATDLRFDVAETGVVRAVSEHGPVALRLTPQLAGVLGQTQIDGTVAAGITALARHVAEPAIDQVFAPLLVAELVHLAINGQISNTSESTTALAQRSLAAMRARNATLADLDALELDRQLPAQKLLAQAQQTNALAQMNMKWLPFV